jgi:hypothetical protein
VPAARTTTKIVVRSSLRLFLSLDIVGSTEFKQASRSGDAPRGIADAWVEPFLSFYQISVEQMEAQWARTCAEMLTVEPLNKSERFGFGVHPEFWKGAGDEVLFSKDIRSPLDAMATIHTFLMVMREHRARFAQKGLQLNVKGTAWLAGFPVNNAEVMLPAQYAKLPAGRLDEPVAENYRFLDLYRAGKVRTPYQLDYIGPSIDLGFRLREHATPRRLVVSADLVWLLCHAHDSCTEAERRRCRSLNIPHIGYDGRQGLKGILGGQPYPLMWIEADPENAIDNAEDALLRRTLSGHSPSSDRVGQIRRFCDLFLSSQTALQTRPYISGCADPEISAVPQDHRNRLESIENHVNGARYQLTTLGIRDRTSGAIPAATKAFASELAKEIGSQVKPTAPPPKLRRRKRGRR